MRNILPVLVILSVIVIFSCDTKEEAPVLTPYEMLTTRIWLSDSLLANGQEAGGEGQLLEKFNGEAEFRTDGTGTFGEFTGSWNLSADNKEITIQTDSMPAFVTQVVELSLVSLKITTPFEIMPGEVINIRMTFKKK